jgi:hypothetical protein
MENIVIRLAAGHEIQFKVANGVRRKALFLLGVRKSGSSILNEICVSLAKCNQTHCVNIAGTFFKQNIQVASWIRDPAITRLLKAGNLYGGFRQFPFALQDSEIFRSGKKLLLVRDPRDALVSEYFSVAFSHSIPVVEREDRKEVTKTMLALRSRAVGIGINEFVLSMASAMNRTLVQYASMLNDKNCLVLKYEDAILNKRNLIKVICSHFQWSCTEDHSDTILKWADVFPEQESPTAFVRRVVPGDHVDKLDRTIIMQLNQILAPALDLFGYPY